MNTLAEDDTGIPLPRVSVVIPCHNYAAYLDAAIASALSQEGVAVDVTVVDDASTDGSLALARRWQAADPRVTVIAHEVNTGHIRTFNDALGAATAPYLVKLDPDDLLPPRSLSRSAAVLRTHPDVAFVYGRVVDFTDEPPDDLDARVRGVRIWPGEEWLAIRARRVRNVIFQPEVMIRRSALAVVGGHRADLPASSDFQLWLKLASVGAVARVSGPVQGLYRIHAASMQRTIHAGKLADLHARVDAFDRFLDDRAGALADPGRFRAVYRASLARDALRLAAEELDDGEDARPYMDAAAALHPPITRGPRWRALRRRVLNRPGAAAAARLSLLERGISGRVRWRRWRRYGV
ncbi:MAG: glycosyltransferase [Microbacterium sp.]|uniref:glycosyltransferase family 2 protein n=1 Tax=Microbacterium sp. TaxID=51671 RepID=UPI0026045C14|nr:glycosyltransferase [Microbacterium sp.]MCX6502865.1 glycosyltransferase [Microbacterium sp.]